MENTFVFDQKINFSDGYAVTINPDRLSVKSGGRAICCDPLFLGEVGTNSPLYARIKTAGFDPGDYLTDHIIFVRAGGGIREAVQRIQDQKRDEAALKKKKIYCGERLF